jgi:hypothetical protein
VSARRASLCAETSRLRLAHDKRKSAAQNKSASRLRQRRFRPELILGPRDIWVGFGNQPQITLEPVGGRGSIRRLLPHRRLSPKSRRRHFEHRHRLPKGRRCRKRRNLANPLRCR